MVCDGQRGSAQRLIAVGGNVPNNLALARVVTDQVPISAIPVGIQRLSGWLRVRLRLPTGQARQHTEDSDADE